MEIEMKESKEFEPVLVKDNVYLSEIVDLQELQLEFGPTISIGFKILEGEFKDKVISGLASANINAKTKLGIWISSMGFKIVPGQKFEMNTLMGRKARILTKAKPRMYNNQTINASQVQEVLPAVEEEKISDS
ncbi:unnamed protein product [marine sediment metagenome]|uniref:Uncharacterized protein n=1 Tax=marine sediment metagenome TaxID=412755 RepID=X1GMJ4_9ZZZZ